MSLSRAQMVISDDDDFTLTERRFFFFLYLFIYFFQGVGAVGRAEKVEWGHQVGNLWLSF